MQTRTYCPCLIATIAATLGVNLPAHAACVDDYLPAAGITCFDDLEQLMDTLLSPTRRKQTTRLVRPHGDQDTPMARHNQYFDACLFFATAPIVEYLGYSRFERFAHFEVPMGYTTRDGLEIYDFDVGYEASPEDLIGLYFTYETVFRTMFGDEGPEIYPCGFFEDEPSDECHPTTDPRVALNTENDSCHWGGTYNIFNPGQEYGQCQTLTGDAVDSFPRFLEVASGGCDEHCACAGDAECGGFFFLNQVLSSMTGIAGANDARNLDPGDYEERKIARRILKAFIDNNTPMLGSFDQGGHFMTVVGYSDLSAEGLPQKAIAADSVQLVYWIVDLLAWDGAGRESPSSLWPWNQHLDGGCEPGGWAAELDTELPADFQLCPMPEGTPEEAAHRPHGIEIVCHDDGSVRSEHFANPIDPFVFDSRNLSCDAVQLRFADGEREIVSAEARRYSYDSTLDRWSLLSRYSANSIEEEAPLPGHYGRVQVVEWDAIWRDNYWLVAQGLAAPSTQRRTTFELGLGDGTSLRLEIAPPDTYGMLVDCIDAGSVVERYSSEADHDVFAVRRLDHDEQMLFPEGSNTRCDTVGLWVNLGEGSPVAFAEIEPFYYGTSRAWLQASSTWAPDLADELDDGLSGSTMYFEWNSHWPQNYWVAATNVGSGSSYGDRKTRINLFDATGAMVRVVEVAPY